jgi:hypothetical protein
MSSSQLLTITESLGFRALVAAFSLLIALLRRIGHGLRNLTRGGRRLVEAAAGPTGPTKVRCDLPPSSPAARLVWFDMAGGRHGPPAWIDHPKPALIVASTMNRAWLRANQQPPLGDVPFGGYWT